MGFERKTLQLLVLRVDQAHEIERCGVESLKRGDRPQKII